ncbi:MAG: radical SAM protein [Candidatus Odinarchaeota archaeon]|nr:radical SAM protein [Candidatus Odinarchaeota archaeon]
MEEYPDVIQIDITNRCNFSCIMCIRNFWEEKLGDMPFDLFRKIADEAFPNIKRVTLYGEGEPLLHPDFIKMVKLAREKLPKEGTIFFSTNGSLLNRNIADTLLRDIGVDSIAFSVDSFDFVKLKNIRIGAEPSIIFKNLRYLSKIKDKSVRDFKLGIEVTLMKSNLKDLPHIVDVAAAWDIDFISVSQIVPYSRQFADEIFYLTISKQSLELSRDILEAGWDIILQSIYEIYALYYGGNPSLAATRKLKSLWNEARKRGTDLNPNLVILHKGKISEIKKAEKIFDRAKKLAIRYGIELELPNLFPDDYTRSCPYVDKNATVIRFDGEVAPCLNYLYTHYTFINEHMRLDRSVSFGNVKNQTIKEIWNSEKYVAFRNILKDMRKNTPWCGNCPYSSTGCWYSFTNDYDCYGNSPSCSECLYSVNIARCLI